MPAFSLSSSLLMWTDVSPGVFTHVEKAECGHPVNCKSCVIPGHRHPSMQTFADVPKFPFGPRSPIHSILHVSIFYSWGSLVTSGFEGFSFPVIFVPVPGGVGVGVGSSIFTWLLWDNLLTRITGPQNPILPSWFYCFHPMECSMLCGLPTSETQSLMHYNISASRHFTLLANLGLATMQGVLIRDLGWIGLPCFLTSFLYSLKRILLVSLSSAPVVNWTHWFSSEIFLSYT